MMLKTFTFSKTLTFRKPVSVRVVLACLFTIAGSGSCVAQLEGNLSPQPLGIGFTRNMNQATMMEYVKGLTEQLEVGETVSKMISNQTMKEMVPKVEQPVNGIAFYMIQGLIPTFANVSFQEVADEADAKRVLEAQKKMMGGNNATIDEEGNGCYRFVRSSSWEQQIPKNKDPAEHVKEINSRNSYQSRGYKNTAELIEKDGKPMVKQSWAMTQYYRYQDNLFYFSDFEELWDMELPTRDSLMRGASGDNDMGVEAYFDRIPTAIKTLGWNMLNSTAGVQMQQRDGEELTEATFRKSSMQFGLNLVKSIMFDVQEANGWIKWADDDEQSIRAAIDFNARRNAGLTKQLKEVSSGDSRFGPILRDTAPATLHVCLKIFEEDDPMVQACAAWIIQKIADLANSSAELTDAANDIAVTLNSISEHRTVEAFLKAGWTEQTDGVIYGGLRLDDNPNLLRAVHAFISEAATEIPVGGAKPELEEINGREVIKIEQPEELISGISSQTGLKISHIYLVHQNACLWMAAGGENSHEILWQSIARCEASGRASRTPLVTANLDVEEWLALPQDDPIGVASLLTWLDANQIQFPPGFVNFGGPKANPQPTPLLQKCLDLGGDRRAGFTVIADKSGLRATAKLGEALGNYYVARMIDMQDQQFKVQQQRREERAEKLKKATKTTTKKSD